MTALLLYDNIPNPSLQRGVDRYFQRVASGMAEAFGSDAAMISKRRNDVAMRRYPIIRLPRRFLGRRIHDRQASAIARLVRPEVVFNAYFGHLRSNALQVFPLYDMIYERFPEHFPGEVEVNRAFIEEKRACLERADLILAISQATADDCLRCYPSIQPERIRVTHLGVDDAFFHATPPVANAPYFLFVGHRAVYKNFGRLVQAFARSGLQDDHELLVVSPSQALAAEEQALIASVGLKARVRLLTAVTDDALGCLYAGATGFVYPSEYEGFGLPILEAMAAGTMVATANSSSMPEVGGKVAFYFDPTEPDEIAARLVEIAGLSAAEREHRRSAGLLWAREFTWQRCCDQTNNAIGGLL
jgi:glycosyltransferase involved in cell wall biosynthesis